MSSRRHWRHFREAVPVRAGKTPTRLETAARLRAGKENHDALERSVVELARLKYKIPLYKADAEATPNAKQRLRYRVTPGLPDRIGVVPPTGRFFGFEFKTGHGALRPVQRARIAELIAAGAAVFEVRSVTEADQFLALLVSGEADKARRLER